MENGDPFFPTCDLLKWCGIENVDIVDAKKVFSKQLLNMDCY